MINYYKILELENYATVEEVKEAYKVKIKKYHPDISSEPNAEEMTKYLNLAKTQLDTPEAKERYDRELKLAYLLEIKRLSDKKSPTQNYRKGKNSYWNSLSKIERQEKLDEDRKIKIREKYLKGTKVFPLWMRVIGLSVLGIWSLQLIYSNFFIAYNSLDLALAILGYFLLIIVLRLASNEAYTYFTVKSLEKPIRFDFEKKIGTWFVMGYLIAAILVNGLNYGRKAYLLKNKAAYTTAELLLHKNTSGKILVSYVVDDKTYFRHLPGNVSELVLLPNARTVIKYAIHEPKISCLVSRDELVDFKNLSVEQN